MTQSVHTTVMSPFLYLAKLQSVKLLNLLSLRIKISHFLNLHFPDHQCNETSFPFIFKIICSSSSVTVFTYPPPTFLNCGFLSY